MRVAVSGATGFVGGHVRRALAGRGDEVVALGRGDDGTQAVVDEDGAVVREGPLAELVAGADAVVHLAGRTVDRLDTPLSAYLDANVALTEDLLRAAVAVGADRFVHASTRLVHPGTVQHDVDEVLAPEPDTFYGLSKLMAEQVVRLYRRRAGLTTTSLRMAQVVGPGDGGRGALPRFAAQAAAGEPLTVHGRGAAVRDVVHVDDVVAAVLAALDADDLPPLVNVGSGTGQSILDLARAAAEAAGRSEDAVEHVDVDDEDTSRYVLDTTLARTALGWEPSVDLVEMARRAVARS